MKDKRYFLLFVILLSVFVNGYSQGSASVESSVEQALASFKPKYLTIGEIKLNRIFVGKGNRLIVEMNDEFSYLPFREELVAYMDAGEDSYSFATGYRMAKKLLEKKESFTALYATSDTLAIGACRALKEAGLDIPGDCSVAGFDGMDMGAYYIPSITTIRQPVEQIAKASAQLLFHMIKGKEKPGKLIYEGELLVRESTAKRKKI